VDAAEREEGERLARQRVDVVYRAIDRLPHESLHFTILPPRDYEDRATRLADLEAAVDRAGRGRLLDEARGWLTDSLDRRVAGRGRRLETGIWGTTDVGRAEDIAAVRLALEDAVAVAVAFDLIFREDAIALGDPGFSLLTIDPLEVLGEPVERVPDDAAVPPWEPSPDDWAASADGGASSVNWRWWTAPHEASQGRLLTVLLITVVGAVAGATLFGPFGILVLGPLAAGVGWLLVGIPRQPDEEAKEDDPGDEPG
jgi:hypothetical protein